MDNLFYKKLGKMNLVTSVVFLVLSAITLALTIWFTIEIATSHLFGITENQEENNIGMAFGIIFIVLIFVIADFALGIMTIVFLAAGIPLLLSSTSLLKMDQVTDVDVIVKKLKRTRAAFIISIIVGSIIALGEAFTLISTITDGSDTSVMFYVLSALLIGLGVFLIVFSAKQNKKVGEAIDQLTQPTKSISQI